MASRSKAPKTARRQHFIARFYLRNFADPLFSDNLCVYDMRERRWERRTPKGVGWFPHLYSMVDMQGNRTDSFDQHLKLNAEDPAAPALKKLATGESLDRAERSAVALFAALTAARSPELMNSVMTKHLDNLASGEREDFDAAVKLWCNRAGKPYAPKSHSEFLKSSCFRAIWKWSQDLQRRLLQWQWHLVHTTRDRPFVTSDRPVFAQWDRDQDVRLVGFPVSSVVALIIIAGGQLNAGRNRSNEVHAMNRQTMERAKRFVVACNESFPADEHLPRCSNIE